MYFVKQVMIVMRHTSRYQIASDDHQGRINKVFTFYLRVLADNTFGDWIDARCPIPGVRVRAGRCDEKNLLWDALISHLP